MRETMSDLPKRKFYSTVNSICTRWLSLGELPDGSCFQRVILSFGSLELIRAADVSDVVSLRRQGNECLKVGKAEEQREIIYLSRNDTGWRRMLNEHELVLKWNDKNPHYPMRSVSLHTMTMLDQLSLLQGSTCASVFAMRWTDQNFGYVYHSWLKLRGVRYIQFDITQGGTTNLDWLSFAKYSDDWSSSMRAIRDADMSMPYEHFHEFVHAALDPTVSKFDSTDSPAELSKVELDSTSAVVMWLTRLQLLHHFEREQRL
ncbi:hypothetical protein GUITHDRAFT_117547 [Guillardia theta CCMP2712]|uniref:Uncharacterized protein n=1 Tax=Guillardia theta (strain CCMP2712) TaxID=905079 RepID=L1IJA2_GUITC|nr:hypothetical protein GUITHDRAFT_117547 [Guillardia theta CCMP2712]EKX36318.1 hypothetical protein GUITHDRAFT_117547 [Guillardia theta CCMP2712]|eukprot:XP_005823298.1 hypothetical protein GUITHDRAFT_117547 [Guillardia theta CCMP2712]